MSSAVHAWERCIKNYKPHPFTEQHPHRISIRTHASVCKSHVLRMHQNPNLHTASALLHTQTPSRHRAVRMHREWIQQNTSQPQCCPHLVPHGPIVVLLCHPMWLLYSAPVRPSSDLHPRQYLHGDQGEIISLLKIKVVGAVERTAGGYLGATPLLPMVSSNICTFWYPHSLQSHHCSLFASPKQGLGFPLSPETPQNSGRTRVGEELRHPSTTTLV